MAQSTPNPSLTDSLITSLCQHDPNTAKLRRRREIFTRKLRSHNYGRTNQFDVESKLDGLQEKFAILCNDELSDALRSRLVELRGKDYKWMPEILDLFLHLSNRPLEHSRIDDLPQLLQTDPERPLTWADIEASDPINRRDDIWKSIRFSGYSSDEEESLDSRATVPTSTADTEEDAEATANKLLRSVSFDQELDESLHSAQFWSATTASLIEISEFQAFREAIFMLHGLPSSIFWRVGETIEIDARYTVCNLNKSACHEIFVSLSTIGHNIDRIRSFVAAEQKKSSLQTFRQSIEDALSTFDTFLSEQEACFLVDNTNHVLSLMALLDIVGEYATPMLALLPVLDGMKARGWSDSVPCMDLLFRAIGRAEATAQSESLQLLEEIFLKTLTTYLRPFGTWIESGKLSDDADIFISRTDSKERSQLWSDWFVLEGDSAQRIPVFMRPHADTIFIAGKSAAMLGLLDNSRHHSSPFNTDIIMTKMRSARPHMISFEHHLNETLQQLIEPQQVLNTRSLHQMLNESCGLRTALSGLQQLYFGLIGSRMETIAIKLYDRIDKCRTDWNDPFVVGQLFKSHLKGLAQLDVEAIKVKAVPGYSRDMLRRRRSVNILKGFSLDYKLPWPLANLISKLSLIGYQRVSTFLIQIRRALHILERQSLRHLDLMNRHLHRQAYTLHHRLLTFARTLLDHMTNLVITAATHELLQSLDQAPNIQAMIKAHNTFVMHLQHRLLLTKALAPLREALIAVLDLCIYFGDVTNTNATKSKTNENGSDADAMSFVTTRSRARRRRKLVDDTDSSDDEEDDDHHEGYSVFLRDDDNKSQSEHIVEIDRKFTQHLSFIEAGLKGLARADQDALFWDILAERLDGLAR